MLCIPFINIGYRNKLRDIDVPVNKLNHLILTSLYHGGLISSFSISFLNPKKYNVVLQLNQPNSKFYLKRMSIPSLRKYVSSSSRFYKSPFFILSTTRGLVTPFDLVDSDSKLGGELLYILHL